MEDTRISMKEAILLVKKFKLKDIIALSKDFGGRKKNETPEQFEYRRLISKAASKVLKEEKVSV